MTEFEVWLIVYWHKQKQLNPYYYQAYRRDKQLYEMMFLAWQCNT